MITLQTLAPTQSAKEARAKRGIQQGCWWQTSFRGCSTDAQVEPKGRRAATKALQVQSLAAQILPELHGFFYPIGLDAITVANGRLAWACHARATQGKEFLQPPSGSTTR